MSLSIKDLLALSTKINLSKSDYEDYRLRVKNMFRAVGFAQAFEVPVAPKMPSLEPDSEPETPFKPVMKSRKKSKKKPKAQEKKHQIDAASYQTFEHLNIFSSETCEGYSMSKVLSTPEYIWKAYYSSLDPSEAKARDQAHAVLALTLGNKYSYLQHGKDDPAYLWAKIRDKFEGPTMHQYLHLSRKLANLQIKDCNNDFLKYASEIELLIRKLQAHGDKFLEKRKVSSLLAGLDVQEYDSIMAVLENKEDISFQETVSRIAAYLRRKEDHKSDYTWSDMTASLRDKVRQCHHCGKKGHTKRTCWELHGKPGATKKGEHEDSNAAGLVDSDDDYNW
ncbi:hypothetical protein AAMO2058_000681900 [Amorphochlora amoebiformis]